MIWSEYGVSSFPLKLPMVGQEEFYNTFKSFTKNKMKTAGMATIFPVIAKWGIGKTRIGFEMISQILGMDEGWIIYDQGREEKVRVFEDNFGDNVLPIYIRYTNMAHEDLMGDTWIGYGTYIALSYLASEPEATIQGAISRELHNALEPRGFDRMDLIKTLEIDTFDRNALLDPDNKDRDRLIKSAIDYLGKFDIHHLLIICDEVETVSEIARYGMESQDEKITRLDSEAIKVITEGIKHEDARKKHPYITFMLLCSPQIGNSITGLGALDRRLEKSEISRNSFADINYFIEHLQKENQVSQYPEGFIQAAYAVAGGNFGWFNVIMADAESYLKNIKPDADTREIFEYLLKTSNRFRESLIDQAAFDFIQCNEKDKHLIRAALLKQLPAAKSTYKDETNPQILLEARAEDGEKLFKEFFVVKMKMEELARFLSKTGYKRQEEYKFANDIGGKFDLDIMLKSLKTFSLKTREHEYIVGSDKETFLDQIRMLYPEEGAEEAAEYIYRYIMEKVTAESITPDYIGPNFAYLRKLNKRYKSSKDDSGYLKDNEDNKALEKHIEEMRKEPGEAQRVISGFARLLETSYPQEKSFSIDNIPCLETKVESGPYLDVHPKNKVTIIWGKDEEKLERVLKDTKLLADGVHPVFVISDSTFPGDLKQRFIRNNPAIGKCLIFITILTTRKEPLEVVALDKDKIDIRDQHKLTTIFRNKISNIKDYISNEVRKWFDEIDSGGWILRPIIYKSNYDPMQIDVIGEAFIRMLTLDATYAELGASPDKKLKDDHFNELSSMLEKSIYIGKANENKGYRETGLFIKDRESFRIAIPSSLIKILEYTGGGRKSENEFLNSFFYSCTEKVNCKKIMGQWLHFIGIIGLNRETAGFFERISAYHLDARYDEVKHWFDNDYKDELKKMETLIKGGYLDVLTKQDIEYKVKLEKAENLKRSINLDALTKAINVFDVWKENLSKLREFQGLCLYIYDREQYGGVTSYNHNLIKNLKIEDVNTPLWQRVRNIRLFLDEIKEFKDPAANKVNEKLEEIKKSCTYRDCQLPPSPIINILKRYKSELEYATDYDTLTTKATIGHPSETLAYKLICGKYGEAKARLDSILEQCGLEGSDTSTLKWNENKGVVGRYNNIFNTFKKIVDFYLDEMKRAIHWRDYFENAKNISTRLDKDVSTLKNGIYILSVFMDNGFQQEIDEQEEILQSKPFEFLDYLDKTVNENKDHIGVIQGVAETVKNKAREERNTLYDDDLIASIDKLRKLQKKDRAAIDIDRDSIPGEKSFKETADKIDQFHKRLEKEGEEFFLQSQITRKTTFRFFKKVVEKYGDINWDEYPEEKKELENMNLIRTKVEVL